MHHWATTRGGKILLLGGLCLLLQQVAVPYRLELWGHAANASLVHLQTGLLLAIAILDRDRWVMPGCYAVVILGWLVRALHFGYTPLQLLIGSLVAVAGCAWMYWCVRVGLRRPAAPGNEPLSTSDLVRFVLFGLLALPLGLAALGVLYGTPFGTPAQVSGLIETLFSKYFGVLVVSLPLVVAWTERGRPPLAGRTGHWGLLLLLMLGGVLSVGLSRVVRIDLGGMPTGGAVLTDYRIAVLAVLTWCMLHMRLAFAMPLLSATLLLMVGNLGGAAMLSRTPMGFLNLLHLALEMGIVLMAMMYYLLASRDREDMAQRLGEQALRDSLTDLPNLRALRRQVAGRDGGCEVACLLLDQTDTLAVGYGLGAQSEVMSAAAARVSVHGVQPFYLGSGQFALLPDECERTDWAGVLRDIEQAGLGVAGQHVRLLPYLGVSRFGGDTGLALDDALMLASNLAFEARARNEVEPLHAGAAHGTLQQAQARLHGTSEALAHLRRADGLVLYFQPVLPLGERRLGGRIIGEVLCRLRDEQGNLLRPDQFLPAVEATRRGPELDLAVVAALFAQLRQAPDLIPACARISVNLTGQSLASESFRLRLLELLDQAPLPLSRLCFEITETVAIFSAEQAGHLLDELRDRGCSIAIDDFGVGMQSFARLKEMPVDIIKIDGSFVRNITREPRDYAMVQASVAVARACGAEVVAEYVEDEATASCLRTLDVHWGQGYLYARPMPLLEGLRWMHERAPCEARASAGAAQAAVVHGD